MTNEYWRQLVDPLGMVFNQASSEHRVEVFQHARVDSSWHDFGVSVMSYYKVIVIHKRHGKWVIHFTEVWMHWMYTHRGSY